MEHIIKGDIESMVSNGANISVLKETEYYDIALYWNRIYQFSEKIKSKKLERGKKALYNLIILYLYRLHSKSLDALVIRKYDEFLIS